MGEITPTDLQKQSPEIFSMETENYTNTFTSLGPRISLWQSYHNWQTNIKEEVNTLGPFWALATFPRSLTRLSFWGADGCEYPVGNDVAVFIPPFAVFSTHIEICTMEWLAVVSEIPLPVDVPNDPVMMPWDMSLIDQSIEGLFANVQKQRSHWINIEKRSHGSRLALKAKHWIDGHFRSECNLKEMSDLFDVDQSVLGRDFKTCYGISPSVYRKKLRITTAMLSLAVEGLSVGEAGSRVGFRDLDHFSKQFRSTLLALPSQFKKK